YFFSGRLGLFIVYMPTIIILMLGASLIESFYILPAHIAYPFPGERFFKRLAMFNFNGVRERGLNAANRVYTHILNIALRYRAIVLTLFVLGLLGSGWLFQEKMKFVMFPREETSQISVRVKAAPSTTKYETAALI